MTLKNVSKTTLQRLILTAAVLVLVAGPGCAK